MVTAFNSVLEPHLRNLVHYVPLQLRLNKVKQASHDRLTRKLNET